MSRPSVKRSSAQSLHLAVGRVSFDESTDALHQGGVQRTPGSLAGRRLSQRRARHLEHPADAPLRGGDHLFHSSHVFSPKGRPLFASFQDVDIEDQLTDLALQLGDLFVFHGFLVLGAGPQGVLGAGQEALLPAFDLGHGETVLASCLGGRGLSLDDAQDQCRPTLGGPALDVLGDLRHDCHLHDSAHDEHVLMVASRFRGAR